MRLKRTFGMVGLGAIVFVVGSGCGSEGSPPTEASSGKGAGGRAAAGAGAGDKGHWDCLGSVCRDGVLYNGPGVYITCKESWPCYDECPPPTNPIKHCPNGCDAAGQSCASAGAGAGGVGADAGGAGAAGAGSGEAGAGGASAGGVGAGGEGGR